MAPVEISIIIPAYNESRCISATLQSAREALEGSACPSYEIVVADDASTDGTDAIAESLGARVVHSGKRNIGATRNVGAEAAVGEILLFLDADTLICAANINEVLEVISLGAIGGGAPVGWSEPTSAFLRYLSKAWNVFSRLTRSPAGSFFFARREAFREAGGFDEEFFVSEELHLGRKLKRIGRLEIISTPVRTSPRKEKEFTLRDHLRLFARLAVAPRRTVTERTHLDIWYTRRGGVSEASVSGKEAPRKA